MILHISSERMKEIKGRSYRITVVPFDGAISDLSLSESDVNVNTIHELDGERAFCVSCGAEFDSIQASNPVEWATAKIKLRKQLEANNAI